MSPEKEARVRSFLFEFKRWATTEAGIDAVALIGSHARNAATLESDLDLLIVVTPPNIYIQHRQWTSLFGSVGRELIENRENYTSLRVWYTDGLEVEYAFIDQPRVKAPLDEGTLRVIASGMKVLFERTPMLSSLV